MQTNVTVGDLTFRENIYGARFLLLLHSSNGGSPKKVVDRNQYVVDFPLVSTQMRLGASKATQVSSQVILKYAMYHNSTNQLLKAIPLPFIYM